MLKPCCRGFANEGPLIRQEPGLAQQNLDHARAEAAAVRREVMTLPSISASGTPVLASYSR